MHGWLGTYSLLALASFAIAVGLTALLVRVAPRLGLIDEPRAEKFHRLPTPVGGGVAIFLSLAPLLLLPTDERPGQTLLILGASGLLALVGLLDDLFHVSAWVKFLFLVALTTLLWQFGVSAATTRVALLDLGLTVLWVTGVSSAFNAIDNMDGLATGITAIAAACFLVVALQTGQGELGALSAGLLGGSLGFLAFNFHPARIFMGDSGSFFLGFFLATLGVLGDWNENELIAAVIPVLVLGLPIFDLTFTVVRRHRSGVTRTALEAITHCDTDHLSHRLVRLGLGTRTAVAFLYLIAASFGLSALTLRNASPSDALLHLLQAGVIVAALVPVFLLADAPQARAAAPAAPRRGASAAGWLLGLLGAAGLAALLW